MQSRPVATKENVSGASKSPKTTFTTHTVDSGVKSNSSVGEIFSVTRLNLKCLKSFNRMGVDALNPLKLFPFADFGQNYAKHFEQA